MKNNHPLLYAILLGISQALFAGFTVNFFIFVYCLNKKIFFYYRGTTIIFIVFLLTIPFLQIIIWASSHKNNNENVKSIKFWINIIDVIVTFLAMIPAIFSIFCIKIDLSVVIFYYSLMQFFIKGIKNFL
ncbi:MAG: hypothetical protein [Bacteriophage sp.]|nr:MAG: hypothetical protein [Bacteriophage sp.]